MLNNAAVQGGHPQKFGHTDYAAWDLAFRTNVMGVMKMCEAFAPHVERGARKLIVNVSSRTSSIANKTKADPDNKHLVPWAWGFTTVGINKTKV